MNNIHHTNQLITTFVEKHFKGESFFRNKRDTVEDGRRCLSHFESSVHSNENYNRDQNLDCYVSWDGLHPVIDKLYDVISEDDQQFKNLKLFELGLAADKETVYNAVVQAIEFYNKNYSEQVYSHSFNPMNEIQAEGRTKR